MEIYYSYLDVLLPWKLNCGCPEKQSREQRSHSPFMCHYKERSLALHTISHSTLFAVRQNIISAQACVRDSDRFLYHRYTKQNCSRSLSGSELLENQWLPKKTFWARQVFTQGLMLWLSRKNELKSSQFRGNLVFLGSYYLQLIIVVSQAMYVEHHEGHGHYLRR